MDGRVLILDEPTSSLDDNEVEKLFRLMTDLKNKGVGILFVTHFLEQVYAVCDRITVMRNGTFVGDYSVQELPRVKLVAAMLGKDALALYDRGVQQQQQEEAGMQEAIKNFKDMVNKINECDKKRVQDVID
jgi:ABC-type sugar transport system ATPase subunit